MSFRWFRVAGSGFSLLDYRDGYPPHLVLECDGCGWQTLYSPRDWAGHFIPDATHHEKLCKYRKLDET